MKRFFIVGCPRSGTTLLQSFLASHSQIESFPESHFFTHLVGRRASYQKLLHLASRQAKPRFYNFLAELNPPELRFRLPFNTIFIGQYIHAFVKVLDAIALSKGQDCWLEKTPDHVLFTDMIEAYIPEAKFIHIMRDGVDVIASLYDVTQKYPDQWDGPWTLDQCINKWIRCTTASLKKIEHPNHYFVPYEQLVQDPKSVITEISHFIELPIDYDQLQAQRLEKQGIILERESWKSMSNKPLYTGQKWKKFKSLFNQEQQDQVLEKLEQFTKCHPTYINMFFPKRLVNV